MKTKPFPLNLASCVLCLFALCSAPPALSQIPQGFNYRQEDSLLMVIVILVSELFPDSVIQQENSML